MLAAYDISTSALVAQRTRLNAISSNLANLSTTRNEAGEKVPYQPRYVVFQADHEIGGATGAPGVKVSSIEMENVPPRLKYQPGHPDANEQGYVAYPAVDVTREFVDALEATRAYEANIGAMEIANDIANKTLNILI